MAQGLEDVLSAIGPGDTSGSETLARYLYQCKVGVQRWLATIDASNEAFVLCEFVDDITTVTSAEILFAQVKTRDRGAWTVAKVVKKGGGVDALVRSFNLAKAVDDAPAIKLELILEGPEGPDPDTKAFFADPTAASSAQRSAIVDLGLAKGDVDEFLGSLKVIRQYHARPSIDAVTIRLLMGLVPGHSASIEALYDKLLERVIAAHIGAAASADPEHPLALQHAANSDELETVEEHRLSRAELLTLLPPVPALEAEQRRLLEAANDGALAMTDLEWKLRVAGANEHTVARAQARRSTASARLAARPTLTGEQDQDLEHLTDRLLEHAEAVTVDVVGSAATAAHAARPADVIYARLVQQTDRLGDLDSDQVLAGDGDLVLGLLCELSDQCRYPWRSA